MNKVPSMTNLSMETSPGILIYRDKQSCKTPSNMVACFVNLEALAIKAL